jgi:hypothetical protein
MHRQLLPQKLIIMDRHASGRTECIHGFSGATLIKETIWNTQAWVGR